MALVYSICGFSFNVPHLYILSLEEVIFLPIATITFINFKVHIYFWQWLNPQLPMISNSKVDYPDFQAKVGFLQHPEFIKSPGSR